MSFHGYFVGGADRPMVTDPRRRPGKKAFFLRFERSFSRETILSWVVDRTCVFEATHGCSSMSCVFRRNGTAGIEDARLPGFGLACGVASMSFTFGSRQRT